MKSNGMGFRGAMVAVALSAVALGTSCGAVNLEATGNASARVPRADLGSAAKMAAKCPNLGGVQAISRVDFAKEFDLDAQTAAKLESSLKAAAELRGIAKQVRTELKSVCGALARDLGADPGNTYQSACNAASRAIKQLKVQAGGRFVLDVVPPKCGASAEVMGRCAAECDVNVKPGEVKLQCEEGKLSGRCDAECRGSCHLEAGASCKGSCHGECTAQFKGECNGECQGQCNGKPTNGAMTCDGKCEGSCSAGAKGRCGGQCRGECEIQGQAKCEGTCTGGCSVEMKAPHCTGSVKPPKMSAECKAECDARVSAQLQCTKPRVVAKFVGVKDVEAAQKLARALRVHLPGILKVSMGMKNHLVRAARKVNTVVKGMQTTVDAMSRAAGSAGARLFTCVAAPFKGAFDATASINLSVRLSVDVQASAGAK